MAYGVSVRLLAEEVRTLAFGAIGAGYVGVGTAIENPARMILIQNLTDENMMFSLNGVTDHFAMLEQSQMILDITSNKTIEQGFYLAEGQRLYVRQLAAPGSGAVYLSVFYGRD